MDSTDIQRQFNVEITEAGISFCVAMTQFHQFTDVLRELFDDGPREEIQTCIKGCSTICDVIHAGDRVEYTTASDPGRMRDAEKPPNWMECHLRIYRTEVHERIGEIRASRGVTSDDVLAETASHQIPLRWKIRVQQNGRILARPETREIPLPDGERIEFRMSVRVLLKEFLGSDAPAEDGIEVGRLTSPLLPYFPLDAPAHPPLYKGWGYWADVETFQHTVFHKYLRLRQSSTPPPPREPLLLGGGR